MLRPPPEVAVGMVGEASILALPSGLRQPVVSEIADAEPLALREQVASSSAKPSGIGRLDASAAPSPPTNVHRGQRRAALKGYKAKRERCPRAKYRSGTTRARGGRPSRRTLRSKGCGQEPAADSGVFNESYGDGEGSGAFDACADDDTGSGRAAGTLGLAQRSPSCGCAGEPGWVSGSLRPSILSWRAGLSRSERDGAVARCDLGGGRPAASRQRRGWRRGTELKRPHVWHPDT